MKIAGGISSAIGLESWETTLDADMEKGLAEEHQKYAEAQRLGKGYHKNPLLRLLTFWQNYY